MTFIPTQPTRVIPGEGSKTAPICIIGEAGGAEEDRLLRPFVGPAGTVLSQCLHAAGLTRSDCYITNVVKIKPRANDISPFFNDRTGTFTAAGKEWLTILYEELANVRSNIIVPLGKVAMAAITGNSRISSHRGYVMQALPAVHGRKTIPTYHPAASLRGQYILRYYISADLKKAKEESAYPEIIRPKRTIIVPETLAEAREWIKTLSSFKLLAIDIEVVNYEVSCIGFAPSGELAVSIPMYHNHWNEEEEAILWADIAGLLSNPGISKLFQNGIFDCHFLATRCGVHVAPPIEDTMIGHHIMYPEMLKGLAFLVSMYGGSQEYYKDMVKFKNIKKEA